MCIAIQYQSTTCGATAGMVLNYPSHAPLPAVISAAHEKELATAAAAGSSELNRHYYQKRSYPSAPATIFLPKIPQESNVGSNTASIYYPRCNCRPDFEIILFMRRYKVEGLVILLTLFFENEINCQN